MNAINQQILRLSIPNIVSNITVPLLGLVDLAMMGHLDDPVYLGAIALGSAIFNVIYSSFGFLRMGTTGFTAQAYGALNKLEITMTLYRSMLVALGLALTLIILMDPLQWLAFKLLDGSSEVKFYARQYFYIRIFAAPASLGLYALHGWFLGMQNARIPMVLAISINSINIGLNFLLVVHFGMKSDGVAWASVIAQYSGLLMGLSFVILKYREYLAAFLLRQVLQLQALRKFFKVNADIFIRTLLLILVLAFFTSRSAHLGDDILAANTLLFQFFFIFSYFADGFAFAGESLTGKARGAGNPQLLKETINRLFHWGWGGSFLFTIFFIFGTRPLLLIMTNNSDLIDLALAYKWWVILLPLASGAAFIWDGIYVGVTASRAMRNTMIFASLFIFIPSYYLTIDWLQNHGLWLALNLFMIFRGLSLWFLSRSSVYR